MLPVPLLADDASHCWSLAGHEENLRMCSASLGKKLHLLWVNYRFKCLYLADSHVVYVNLPARQRFQMTRSLLHVLIDAFTVQIQGIAPFIKKITLCVLE